MKLEHTSRPAWIKFAYLLHFKRTKPPPPFNFHQLNRELRQDKSLLQQETTRSMALYTQSHLCSSLVQYLTVSHGKRTTTLETGWPQPPPRQPTVGRWPASRRAALPRRPAPPTPRGGRGPARSRPAAGRLLARTASPTGLHPDSSGRAKTTANKKTAYFQKPEHHKHDPNSIQRGIFFASKGCVLTPQT